MQRFAGEVAGVVAVDGKTLRRSFDRASVQSPLHLVRAWAADQRLVLAQVAVDGTLVTAAARHCQCPTAAQIVAQQGNYVLALKANQGTLHDDVRPLRDESPSLLTTAPTTVDKQHDRIEIRTSAVSTELAWRQEQHAWPGLAAFGKIPRTRESRGEVSTETAYDLLSTPCRPPASAASRASTEASRTNCPRCWM